MGSDVNKGKQHVHDRGPVQYLLSSPLPPAPPPKAATPSSKKAADSMSIEALEVGRFSSGGGAWTASTSTRRRCRGVSGTLTVPVSCAAEPCS